ncbi:MAG: O-methyltransferase [Eubacteriales bacterium]|nr:O-methyltransferase [Eubacteriales bacterium]MDY3332806.1 O-methyltransferase [Gallibacter sp.]
MSNITNEDITQFLDERYIQNDKGLYELRLQCEELQIPIIQRDVEMLLSSLLLLKRPKKILEIGTAVGYSAMLMHKVSGAEIVTLEKMEDMVAKAEKNLIDFGVEDNITIFHGDARKTIEDIKHMKFDMVFIDGAKSHYLKFWKDINEFQMLDNSGVIFCDNVLMRGMTVDSKYDLNDRHRTNIRHMREFLDYIGEDTRYHTSILSVGDGVTISYKL